jgi:methyl-accepting chemotaxis protein
VAAHADGEMRTTSDYLTHLHIVGDRLLLGVIGGCLLLSLALAPWYQTFDAALLVGLPAAIVPALLTWMRPGALVTRCAIAASLMIFAALQIHQSHGMVELHFSIFVMLAFLLFYRDWIPLVFAAGIIAVHHLAFDAMQRGGLPIWVFGADGGLGVVLVHAAFVVFETALLVWMAVRLRAEIQAVGCDPRELSEVAQQLAHGNLMARVRTMGNEASLAQAMELMRVELQSHLERERASLRENSQIRIALDRVTIGAMLVDEAGKIVYVNDYARSIFEVRAHEIRRHAPSFDINHMVGTAFADLHSNASHQRDLLAHLAGGQSHEFSMGDAVFRITANPVMDAQGTRLGTVVQWVDRTLEVGVEDDLKATVARAIEGDLTARVAVSDKNGFFQVLSVGVNELVGKMADAVRTMSEAASQVRVGADEISRGNQHLSERTEQQAASLEQTASSMQEMTSTVKRNAENAAQANQLAATAREQAERGGRVVSSAVKAMSQIDAASKKIADIIGVIDEIAFQTNLLALNAAVEAARAGDQGRGFAVVAAEVRNLASRSAGAAREIKALINDSVNKVSEGTSLVNESGTVLVEIVDSVKRVTDVVAAIALSSREQAAGIEMVNKAVTVMDSSTQQNGALVEEASAAALALTEQATALAQLIARYNVGGEQATPAAIRVRPKAMPSAPAKPPVASPAVDKRGAKRPWSGRAKALPSSAAPARDTLVDADSVWKEF